ncbi:MAG: hypothetical protein Q7J85_03195 [Bacillota bacterium]|nr:hypothetical protein [Bacillota bacterium]
MIGDRLAGSQTNWTAANFIAGEMKHVGYEVVTQEYPCPDWQALSGRSLEKNSLLVFG